MDTITGGIYGIPPDRVAVEEGKVTFKEIPVYDAPAFITDRGLATR